MTDDTPHFLLDAQRNVRPATYKEWAEWQRTTRKNDLAQWQVGKTDTATAQVSTVFTGWDLRVWGEGPPQPFETLVFGGALADTSERTSTWADAEAAHAAVVARVREAEAAAQADDDTPSVTGPAAEASTAVPPDPRAVMAAMGVSCATCRHWERALDASPGDGWCMALDAPDARRTGAAFFCAVWERRA